MQLALIASRPGTNGVDDDTELFESGLIDSMRILQLIAWTERETGRRVQDQQIQMDNFHTPQRIAAPAPSGSLTLSTST